MLEAQREAHELQLAQLKAESVKLEEEHLIVLANAQERIQQQSDMLHDYTQMIKDLRDELKENAAREQAAAREATKHEAELKKLLWEREEELAQQFQDREEALKLRLQESKCNNPTFANLELCSLLEII